jgi:hypothetical protein
VVRLFGARAAVIIVVVSKACFAFVRVVAAVACRSSFDVVQPDVGCV